MAWLSILAALQSAAMGPPPELLWPLDCRPGETCWVQNFFDHDLGPGRRDYACGSVSYDGHDGTDIRLRNLAAMRAGVAVLAAAPGTINSVRDGVADVSIRTGGAAAVKGRECGNGVLIEHARGWQTQYCHMRRGSITVRPGQRVAAGERLGQVGLSGETEFPHLHLSVRVNGTEVDPFAYGAAPGACRSGRSLWSLSARAQVYRSPQMIEAGFTDGPVSDAALAEGAAGKALRRASSAVVAYVHAIGLEAGDIQELRVVAPGGRELARNAVPALDQPKVTYRLFAGSKANAGAWPAGDYAAEYVVRRGGAVVLRQRWTTRIG
jgi:hypothetical protein